MSLVPLLRGLALAESINSCYIIFSRNHEKSQEFPRRSWLLIVLNSDPFPFYFTFTWVRNTSRVVGSGARFPEFKSWFCHLPTLWPWAASVTQFPLRWWHTIHHGVGVKIQHVNLCKALRPAPGTSKYSINVHCCYYYALPCTGLSDFLNLMPFPCWNCTLRSSRTLLGMKGMLSP